jgi:hypothetical protein
MSFYAIALFAHIVGVIVIFMATAIEFLCLYRMRGATTTDQLREWASLTKTTATLFPVGGAAMVVSGLYMSLTAWDLTVPWIGLSVAVVVVMSVFGPAVNSRRLEAIAASVATAPSGPIPAELARRVQDPFLLASVHTLAALGIGVVFLKVARPDLVGASAALAVAVVAGVLSAHLASRGASAPAEAKPISPAVASDRV